MRFEVTHPAPDGQLHYVDFSLKPVRDARGEVVLLIPEGHDMACTALESYGYRVLAASNAEDAWRTLVTRHGKIDLLVLERRQPND